MTVNSLLATVAILNELFGYDVVIDGDAMTGAVYCNGNLLYEVRLI